MNKKLIMKVLETMLFIWGEPLDSEAVSEALEIPKKEVVSYFEELVKKYDDMESGLMIRRIDDSFQICTRKEMAKYITCLCTPVKEKRLSNAALEVLAIIAYKQPISKSVVDSIRGVKSDRAIEGLLKRELIEEKGRSNSIGRPMLYGTTNLFLEKLGISSISELPNIEFADEADIGTQQISLEI